MHRFAISRAERRQVDLGHVFTQVEKPDSRAGVVTLVYETDATEASKAFCACHAVGYPFDWRMHHVLLQRAVQGLCLIVDFGQGYGDTGQLVEGQVVEETHGVGTALLKIARCGPPGSFAGYHRRTDMPNLDIAAALQSAVIA
jgi:hypothetical protein